MYGSNFYGINHYASLFYGPSSSEEEGLSVVAGNIAIVGNLRTLTRDKITS